MSPDMESLTSFCNKTVHTLSLWFMWKGYCQMSKRISNVLITLEVRDSGRKRQSINDSASCLKKL